jgi:hypothetical protein
VPHSSSGSRTFLHGLLTDVPPNPTLQPTAFGGG